MLTVFHGADEFRMSEALRALKASLDQDGMLETNTTVLAGRGLAPDTLIQHAAAVPFLGGARLVVVEGLLAAAGARRGVVEAWQPLLDFLAQMPETSHVVLYEPPARRDDQRRGRGAGSSPLLAALRQRPNVRVTEFAELRPYAVRGQRTSEAAEWLLGRARERGVALEPDAAGALVDLVGSNLRMLASELDKLATYAGARAVSAEDVRLLTPQAREESIFALVDAVVEGHAALALRLLRQAMEEGSQTAPGVQAMLARQVRHLVRAGELLAGGAAERAVGEATGVRSDFAVRKLVRQARSADPDAAVAALREIERADHRVKTGRLTDVLALELLVVRLAALMSPAAGRRRRAVGGRG